ncbi:MAG: hypothetical protein H6557_33825 [Lewinellaceae bacterium]|nr:hypothetical protein [Phaeodactylibacter sp.]MCB9041620.1 hypothetical protein [Lewinellaceae bacterium]
MGAAAWLHLLFGGGAFIGTSSLWQTPVLCFLHEKLLKICRESLGQPGKQQFTPDHWCLIVISGGDTGTLAVPFCGGEMLIFGKRCDLRFATFDVPGQPGSPRKSKIKNQKS